MKRRRESSAASRRPRPRGGHRVAAVLMAVAGLGIVACARTSVQDVRAEGSQLPKPQMIFVHDFGVTAGDVALDTSVVSRLRQMGSLTPAEEQHITVGHEVSRVLTQSLVKELQKLGIPAEPASAGSTIAGPTLSLEGQILSIDEGNKTKRMIIGFGAGASEVRVLVQLYETTAQGRRDVDDFYTTVKSSRKPGMGPMAGIGAASGRAATSAGVSGGLGLASERSQTVEGDADHAAKEIVKDLAAFFARQGWITADQADRVRSGL